MSCCAPGSEGDITKPVPSSEEMLLASRDLGEGRRQIDLSVPGVHCGACIVSIEKALQALDSIDKARVNLSTKRVSIVWQQGEASRTVDPAEFVGAITSATGYDAYLFDVSLDDGDRLQRDLLRAVALCGFAAANIMLLSVSVWSGADAATRDLFHWISAMIAAPALIYGGRFFYASAWAVLKRGRTNMDVPIALAITLSYAVSLWETLHHGEHAWFDATVSLLFFLLIGRTLDHIMRDRARAAISGLARLSPRGAMVVSADGVREYRPVEEVRPGDRVAIAMGERIPVDGVVEWGSSDIDVSIVTGESVPQAVAAGTSVHAGTLSLTGSMIIKVTASARESFLAEVIGLMEVAEGAKAGYRRLADRAAQYYSPAVHLLALTAFFAWGFAGGDWKRAMLIAIAVLIITCPCALGLAVPVVQVVAAGRLFRNGIMVKDGSAMERLAQVDSVLFDKTGTLTLGRPKLINAAEIPVSILSLAAGLAAHSRHPLSRAICSAVAGPFPLFDDVIEIPGSGLEARRGDSLYRLGNRRFACGDQRMGEGTNLEVVFSRDGIEIAAIRFEDALREDAASAIHTLAEKGMGLGLISGDRTPTVRALAGQLAIADWMAEVSPKGKADHCAALTRKGHRVLMVGDGINDAPALAAAHVSMAPATAADIGRQAADFVFMHESLNSVPIAIDISRRAGKLIRENFALAIGYNIIAVPIALAGYATPLIAAVAMSTSSIIVVANALRLNRTGTEGLLSQTEVPAQAAEEEVRAA
ncbi:Cu2+-exporting ATPase [Rhizobium sp. NFR07]|uniref:cation-translocating P-type ATPase n=1 Tax=Rhizobium sp. NFR07 TaxID=1566262 RepID=UPI0008E647E7|nr:cation-translocating P-type ATPase [Rhizobium sp. NFR07]SFB37946.1 Cu2+-exporting ATPase [Rhizobium sp. NFR07]